MKMTKSYALLTKYFRTHPLAMALRGYRGKMEWTRRKLADKLDVAQNRSPDMESGKRRV